MWQEAEGSPNEKPHLRFLPHKNPSLSLNKATVCIQVVKLPNSITENLTLS